MNAERPLFVPLYRRYFEQFESGEKKFEFREYGPRWNERTCRIGRAVVLSMGYGKARRLRARVVSFERKETHGDGWAGVFSELGRAQVNVMAVIGIEIEKGAA